MAVLQSARASGEQTVCNAFQGLEASRVPPLCREDEKTTDSG